MAKDLSEIREELQEALTTAQRVKRRMVFRRSKAKIKKARERAQKRMAPKEKLEKRAMKQARKKIEMKILGGKTKDDLPFAARTAIEKKVDQRSAAIKRIAKRMFPGVRKAELERLQAYRRGGSK
jgi:hypothetical protein